MQWQRFPRPRSKLLLVPVFVCYYKPPLRVDLAGTVEEEAEDARENRRSKRHYRGVAQSFEIRGYALAYMTVVINHAAQEKISRQD